jgi:uncharacterized membrane protein YoaK (UPF0700 family)
MKRLLHLAEDRRSPYLNIMLGSVCAFVSGAINSGGFIVVGRYTSHITGVVAATADALILGHNSVAIISLAFVGIFFIGALISSLLIRQAERLRLHSRFALSFLVGGGVLMGLGWWAWGDPGENGLILTLGFFLSMGIQNATVTRLSDYGMRATHMTGIITDLAIEFAKWVTGDPFHSVRMKLLTVILGSFFFGGVVGAYTFNSRLGVSSLFLYGGILMGLSVFPVYRDIHIRLRYQKKITKRIP